MPQTGDRHFLHHGELSDAPGRNESWNDYVRYRGKNRWELITEGTDFDGRGTAEPTCERMSTRTLVNWILELDAEIAEGSLEDREEQDEDADDAPRELGPYGERLLEIAGAVDAPYCVACLKGWVAGSWPPKKPAPRILAVTGVMRRGIWIRVYHSVFLVETSLGPAYLYPPGADRSARLVLRSETSMSPGSVVKVPKALLPRIEELRPALAALRQ
jgi:hypothetical protein